MLLLVERDQNSSLDKGKASFKELMGFFSLSAFEATDEKFHNRGLLRQKKIQLQFDSYNEVYISSGDSKRILTPVVQKQILKNKLP